VTTAVSLMAAWKLGPALAAGCTMVLKVAEDTPLSRFATHAGKTFPRSKERGYIEAGC